jgi:hypothetical protein
MVLATRTVFSAFLTCWKESLSSNKLKIVICSVTPNQFYCPVSTNTEHENVCRIAMNESESADLHSLRPVKNKYTRNTFLYVCKPTYWEFTTVILAYNKFHLQHKQFGLS